MSSSGRDTENKTSRKNNNSTNTNTNTNTNNSTNTNTNNMHERYSINAYNILNSVGYILNAAVVFGIGVNGVMGTFKTNSELSEKYQTLITPAGWAFSIWSIIFLSQFIWAALQLFSPNYRGRELVQKGVKYYYFVVCLAQSAWTLAFGMEKIALSMIAMSVILIFLLLILWSQGKLLNTDESYKSWEFWWARFPFVIHASWIIAATVVNANVVLVWAHVPAMGQIIAAVVSLLILLSAALACYYDGVEPLYRSESLIVPFVLAWALFAVFVELGSPNDLIIHTFTSSAIHGVRTSAGSVSVAMLFLAIFSLVKSSKKGYEAVPSDEDVYVRASD